MSKNTNRAPVVYIPHGGGPLPLLNDPAHASLTRFLSCLAADIPRPKAILVISAHWEEDTATLGNGDNPDLFYDYYGFSEEAYKIEYPAPGAPDMCNDVAALLREADIPAALDSSRGFDHGLFVPLKLLYPDADVPCAQLSLLSSLGPAAHIRIGQSLCALRKQNVLILGSGMSFHNMQAFMRPDGDTLDKSIEFDNWLHETCCEAALTREQKTQRLVAWQNAPSAPYCHPREEHLLPLHVCFGAAMEDSPQASVIFSEPLFGTKISGFLWR